MGGSINIANPLRMRVTAVGADTVMAEIQRMIERAQADKPPLAQLADRIAAHFIAAVLLIVLAVALYWWTQGNPGWFEICAGGVDRQLPLRAVACHSDRDQRGARANAKLGFAGQAGFGAGKT